MVPMENFMVPVRKKYSVAAGSAVVFCLLAILAAVYCFSGMAVVTVELSAREPVAVSAAVSQNGRERTLGTKRLPGGNERRKARFVFFFFRGGNVSLAIRGSGPCRVDEVGVRTGNPFVSCVYDRPGAPGGEFHLEESRPAVLTLSGKEDRLEVDLVAVLIAAGILLWVILFFPSILAGSQNTALLSTEVRVSHRGVFRLCCILLAVSYPVFLLTHLRFFIAVPAAAVFVFGAAAYCWSAGTEDGRMLKIPFGAIVLLIAAALLFAWLAGQGGYFPQKDDHMCRNAILRDLIMESWPVAYDHIPGSRLVYYYNYWLIPAGAAKLFLPFGEAVALEAGHFFLFLWTSFWLFAILLLCCCKLRIASLRGALVLVAVFFSFSGMDCVGRWLLGETSNASHMEWWTYCQYSSVFTQLGWVFNQAVPAWLCTILIFDEKKVWRQVIPVAFCFVYAPFPAVGLAGIVAVLYLSEIVRRSRDRTIPELIGKTCGAENLAVVAAVVPVMSLFYLSNGTVSAVGGALFRFLITDLIMLRSYFLFVGLEFLLIALLLLKDNRKNVLFYAILPELFVLPAIYCISDDFCMRVSIPALCLLCVFSIEFLLAEGNSGRRGKVRRWMLILFLAIGAATPLLEIGSSAYRWVYSRNWRRNEYCGFAGKTDFNFVSPDAERKIFFKYLAKRPSRRSPAGAGSCDRNE